MQPRHDVAPVRKFDLNIDKILEDWSVADALRELLANALDERVLTDSADVEVFKDAQGRWHVRDYGRGLRYEHLTQSESDEKAGHPRLIGRFGVGLKDALATFDRRGIDVLIRSPHGDLSLVRAPKADFADVVTLHAAVMPPSAPSQVGTEVLLAGCRDADIEAAKQRFLKFSGETVLESTWLGEILERREERARIYVNGLLVAEEENFLFSYNITSLTKAIRAALNRERRNVGRSAYSERVKEMLLAASSGHVAEALVGDLRGYDTGELHDELGWADVSAHACKLLSARERVVFLTAPELADAPDIVDEARRGGYRVVAIPESIRQRISGQRDLAGNLVRDLSQFLKELDESFAYQFVDEEALTTSERRIFRQTPRILRLIGGKPRGVKAIRISSTMRKKEAGLGEALGTWEEDHGWIVIKRSQLRSLARYAGTLLHEVAHATSGEDDVSRGFEEALTALLGKVAEKALR